LGEAPGAPFRVARENMAGKRQIVPINAASVWMLPHFRPGCSGMATLWRRSRFLSTTYSKLAGGNEHA
jgi:hypothetical protein